LSISWYVEEENKNKDRLSSDSPRVVNTHPERRCLEFSKIQHEEQGTLPTTNTPTLVTRPAVEEENKNIHTNLLVDIQKQNLKGQCHDC
jgi:hypothetical protein